MFKYAWTEVVKRKYRSALAIVSIVIASSLFLAVWGIVRSLTAGLEDVFQKSGSTMSAQILYEALPFKRARMARNLGPIPEEALETIRKIPAVIDCSGQLHFWVWIPRLGSMSGMAGIDPAYSSKIGPLSTEIEVLEGRLFKPGDLKKAVLDQRYAKRWKLKSGDSFRVCDIVFEVIGIILPKDIRLAEAEAYIPLADAQEIMVAEQPALVKGKVVNTVLIKTNDLTGLESLKDSVSQVIRVHGLKYGLKQFRISVFTASRIFAQAAGISILAHRSMKIISLIVLALSILLMVRTALGSVEERIGEICILKAVGWRSKDIALLLVFEMIFITVIGTLIGCLMGKAFVVFWANNIIADIPAGLNPFPCIPSVPMPTQVRIPGVPLWDLVLLAFFVTSIIAVLSGAFAAKYAAKIDPIEGLKRRMTL